MSVLYGAYRESVSTHSRPKAAGLDVANNTRASLVSTHSRPKAAGAVIGLIAQFGDVSTHSRPKAAGWGRRLPLC